MLLPLQITAKRRIVDYMGNEQDTEEADKGQDTIEADKKQDTEKA